MNAPRATPSLAVGRFTDIRWFDQLESTNLYLAEQARTGAAEGMVAVTDFQSAGRGRRDRTWIAPSGSSLLMSVLLRPAISSSTLSACTNALALAATQSCEELGAAVELKWPNDLMAGERKLAGVLAESVIVGSTVNAVVVGIGLNVEWPEVLPTEIADRAVALSHLGISVTREELVPAILTKLDNYLAHGFPEFVMREFADRCDTVGQRVTIESTTGSWNATAQAITDTGALVVIDDDGVQREVTADDVVHLREG